MPGFAPEVTLISPDGYEATLEGVTAAQDENAKVVPISLVIGKANTLNWSLRRVQGPGGKDVLSSSSAAPWVDALSENPIPDAELAGGATVNGTWTITVPADATVATIPALALAFNEAP